MRQSVPTSLKNRITSVRYRAISCAIPGSCLKFYSRTYCGSTAPIDGGLGLSSP